MTLIQFETVTPPPATLGMLPMRDRVVFRRPIMQPIQPLQEQLTKQFDWDPKGPIMMAKNAEIIGFEPRPRNFLFDDGPALPPIGSPGVLPRPVIEGWIPRPMPVGPVDTGASLPSPTPIQPFTCPPPPPCVCSFQSTPTPAPIGAPTPAPAPIPPPAPLYSAATASMFATPSGSAPSMYATAGPSTNSMFAKVQGGGSQAASVSGQNALSGLPEAVDASKTWLAGIAIGILATLAVGAFITHRATRRDTRRDRDREDR